MISRTDGESLDADATQFNCCGYLDAASPPFQVDSTCPTALEAAQKLGCVGRFSDFANSFLDIIFTGLFGIVGK